MKRLSPPWLRVWLVLLCALALLGAPAARAVCPDESGIGGTGLGSDEASGVGGTGLSDEDSGLGGTGAGEDDDESGVGGTGLRTADRPGDDGSGTGGTGLVDDDESGLGGTGLIGTITAYGSVCVNGFTVEYDDETRVEENGAEARSSELAIGSVVVVDAERQDGALRARQIGVRNAAMGPATRIDPEARTLEVVGQTVEVPAGALLVDRVSGVEVAALDDWAPGEYLAVSGLRQSDGHIVASRVERRAPRDEVSATGRLEDTTGGAARLGGASVAFAAEGRGDGDGAVLVRGRWNARDERIEDARSQPAYRFREGVEELSLEGFVQEIDDEGRGRVGGVPVLIARDVRGDRAARGDRVRMSGRLDRDGRLRAREVRVDRDWRDRVEREARPARGRHPARSRRPRRRRAGRGRTRPRRSRPRRPRPGSGRPGPRRAGSRSGRPRGRRPRSRRHGRRPRRHGRRSRR
jgi:hypothetical protein